MNVLLSLNTVQPIEVFWVLIALIGMGFSVSNLVASQRSVRFLKSKRILNGRVRLAKNSRITEFVRLLIQSIEIMIGVLAMTLAPGPDVSTLPPKIRISSYAIEYGLIGIAILTLFQSFNSFRLRRYFLTSDKGDKGDKGVQGVPGPPPGLQGSNQNAGGNHDTH
jgi:hypothetical protein